MYIWLVVAVLVSAGVNLVFGMSEFAGFDLSPLIDGGWRVMQGQIPSVDFLCTFPPTTCLGTAAAFRLFGVHWVSILLAEDVAYLVLCLLGLRLCSLLLEEYALSHVNSLPWIYLAAQTIVLLSVNHLWHSTTASGFAAYAMLAAYTLLRVSGPASRWEAAAHLAFAFAVLLLSKPNTSWATVVLCVACLLYGRQWALACVTLGVGAAAAAGLLAAFHISVIQALKGYAGLSGRAFPQLFFVGIWPTRSRLGAVSVVIIYAMLAVPVLRIAQAMRWEFRPSSANLVCFAGGLVALAGLGTNWDLKLVDVPPLLVGAALLAIFRPGRYGRVLPSLQWSAALLCVFAVVLGTERFRMKGDGPWAGARFGQGVAIDDRFFGRFETRESFAEVLREVDGVVSRSQGKRLFFGPRMEFMYAREGLSSPHGLPLWWHPGTSYPVNRGGQIEQNWVDDRFDVLIFAKNDRDLFPGSMFPERLWGEVAKKYRLDPGFAGIDVYYRVPLGGADERR